MERTRSPLSTNLTNEKIKDLEETIGYLYDKRIKVKTYLIHLFHNPKENHGFIKKFFHSGLFLLLNNEETVQIFKYNYYYYSIYFHKETTEFSHNILQSTVTFFQKDFRDPFRTFILKKESPAYSVKKRFSDKKLQKVFYGKFEDRIKNAKWCLKNCEGELLAHEKLFCYRVILSSKNEPCSGKWKKSAIDLMQLFKQQINAIDPEIAEKVFNYRNESL